MARTLISIILLFVVCGTAQETEVFQCQPSQEQNGQFFFPNISDSYANQANLSTVRPQLVVLNSSTTYIFPVPSMSDNCNGTVLSMRYCYQAHNRVIDNGQWPIFIFLALTQDGMQFTVDQIISIETVPQASTCTSSRSIQFCCSVSSLNSSNQFQISQTGFAFGVEVLEGDIQLLASNEYDVMHFFTTSISPLSRGQILNVSTSVEERSLVLLRLFIGTASNTEMVSDGGVTTLSKTTLSDGGPVTTVSNGGRSAGEGTNISAAVATSVLVIALLATIAVVVVVIVVFNRRRKVYKTTDKFVNPCYEEVNSESSGIQAGGKGLLNPNYALSGPNVNNEVTEVETELDQEELKHDYPYAVTGAYEVPVQTIPRGTDIPSITQLQPRQSIPKRTDGTLPAIPPQEEEEDIYMDPAQDENGLFAQLLQLKTKILSRSSVVLSDQIGSGQFGTVYKGVLVSAGGEVEVAVKTLKEGSGEEDRVKFLQEATIMGQFKHPNVVTMHGVVTAGEPILLVIDLLEKGDLKDHLQKIRLSEESSINIDDHTLLSYCRQVASGMAYLSSKAFVHRDLAARNILINEDEICKIADFGMSRDLMEESYYISHGGKIPVKWTAPEALHYKKYSSASDVWSYGALMYEIWSVGHKPFEGFSNSQSIQMLEKGFRLAPPPGCPRVIYTIMMSCWDPVALNRPSFSEISRQLSRPDPKLLKWSEEDKSVHPEAAKLGADLLCGEDLYKDLQTKYN